MKITANSISILEKLKSVLVQVSDDQYQSSLDVFSGATLGQHVRHIIEFYDCLIENDTSVSYDDRKRSIDLETSIQAVCHKIDTLCLSLNEIKEDRPLKLKVTIGIKSTDGQEFFDTSLFRELLYAFEHAIHHMAIIKIGLIINYPSIEIPKHFGVAESTIRYKENQCAQ